MIIVIIAVVWIVCAIPAYGGTFAYFWNEYPQLHSIKEEREDMFTALVLAIGGGPITLIFAWIMTSMFCHGFKWHRTFRG